MQMNPFPPARRLRANGGRAALLLLFAGVIAGCQQGGVMTSDTPPLTDARDKFPITVDPKNETMALSPLMAGKALSQADAERVTQFAGGYLQNGHGPLAVILPVIPNTPQMTSQIQAINAVLADRGVPAAQIEWRIATPAAPSVSVPSAPGGAPAAAAPAAVKPVAPLVFSYTRYVASVARECGAWEEDAGSRHDNLSWSNFGCSYQHNLAAMVSDPLDLKQPRASTPVDVDRRTVVIKAYREGQKTATERGAEEKGTVSEVVK